VAIARLAGSGCDQAEGRDGGDRCQHIAEMHRGQDDVCDIEVEEYHMPIRGHTPNPHTYT
jgi:hypothetical protein